MDLVLQDSEAALLLRVLTEEIGDLRVEIGKTESHDLRESLKRDEAALRSIVRRLDPASRL